MVVPLLPDEGNTRSVVTADKSPNESPSLSSCTNRPTRPDPYLNGGIDDFRLYDYALTDRQVYELASVADGRLVQEDRDGLSLGDLSAVTTDLVLPSCFRFPHRGGKAFHCH